MVGEKSFEISPEEDIFTIGKKTYRPKRIVHKSNGHIKSVEFEEVDVKKHREMVSKLAELISERVKTTTWLESALADLGQDKLRAIEKEMKKKKPKVKATKGCFSLKIGKTEMPIMD